VLVACCDGVGTKVKLAIELNRFDTIGVDLVAMSLNDLVVQGAEPLFFLDYIACNTVHQPTLSELVESIAEACRECGCALLGGETAEMSDLYAEGDMDLAGFAVGVLELDRAIDTQRVEPGDVILGLESDGVHSNGHSLVRAIIDRAGLDLNAPHDELPGHATLGDALLAPTRLYARTIPKLLAKYRVKKIVSGMAHVTGGGLAGNLERALHPRVDARIETGSWPVPPVFDVLQRAGAVEDAEMDRVFNMGIGYVLTVRPSFAKSVARHLEKLGERVHTIGVIEPGEGRVVTG
jgi:phosphoribosylformylglycinamidine cyclo-ligase